MAPTTSISIVLAQGHKPLELILTCNAATIQTIVTATSWGLSLDSQSKNPSATQKKPIKCSYLPQRFDVQ
eukprot:3484411-Amphidinium_carterae.2